jgi:hypothetical protein
MVYLFKIQKEFLKRGLFFGYFIAHRALNTLFYETRVKHVEVVCDEFGMVEWWNGGMAEWRNGGMAGMVIEWWKWWNG